MNMTRLILAAAVAFAVQAASAQSLSFEIYKTKVEPLFLKKRAGHARCVVCHEASNNAFHLEPLASGAKTWTEEQSRRNFESVSQLVAPGKPETSPFLLHPLAPEAGGDEFHSGGRQFTSKNDADWKVLADWVRQAK